MKQEMFMNALVAICVCIGIMSFSKLIYSCGQQGVEIKKACLEKHGPLECDRMYTR